MNTENISLLYKSFNKECRVMISDGKDSSIYREAFPRILKVEKISGCNPENVYVDKPTNLPITFEHPDFKHLDENVGFNVDLFVNDKDIDNLKRFPYVACFVVPRQFQFGGDTAHYIPVGFITFDNDIDNIENYITSLPKYENKFFTKTTLLKQGYSKPNFSSDFASDRTLYLDLEQTDESNSSQSNNAQSEFGPNNAGKRVIENLRIEEWNSFADAFSDSVSDNNGERDWLANLKKVKVGIVKNGIVTEVKKTNMVLNKNKNTYYGMNADGFRKLEYDKIAEIAVKDYNSETPVLLESFWIRKHIKNKSIVYDSNNNPNRTLFVEIDPKTHLIIGNVMYLRNGDIINEFGEIIND